MPKTNYLVLQQMQANSEYNDRVGTTYHFPNKKKLKGMKGAAFIYYDPETTGYFGRGRVHNITSDPADSALSYAEIHDYQPFQQNVPVNDKNGARRESGPSFNKQNSLRWIDPAIFGAICAAGGLGPMPDANAYGVDAAAAELFIDRAQIEHYLALLKRRKNLILQGPPGVGKTFAARRLAYAAMGAKSQEHVTVVQFHPSYSYEDFVQGLRPAERGGFELKDGIFVEFCNRARANEAEPYFFLIDEINRGQLAKIFGELMMLIEPDKRGPEHAIPLMYAKVGDKPFYIPGNVHFIGTMNTADRSLSLVDYALRRRFAFVSLAPAFSSPAFERELTKNGRPTELIQKIRDRMNAVNKIIAEDVRNLGSGYQIGHSFFCGEGGKHDQWYEDIMTFEVRPLLAEYWIDQPKKLLSALDAIGS